MSRSSQSTRNPALVAAVLVFFGMVAVIASVQGFEHIGGYIPCKLCLAQRQPYYYAFPVSLIAILSRPCRAAGAGLRSP